MFQYDLTETRLFDTCIRDTLPNEAEMFVLTVALLIIRDAAYSDLQECDLVLSLGDIEDIASYIETRFPAFCRDVGQGRDLRERLRDFFGLRIGIVFPQYADDSVGRR